jgi:hypothetical protein
MFGENSPDLVQMLKEAPDEIVITTKYMAVYLSEIDKVMFVPGDYTKHTDDEINEIFVRYFDRYIASMN